jgi:hypothetical protein
VRFRLDCIRIAAAIVTVKVTAPKATACARGIALKASDIPMIRHVKITPTKTVTMMPADERFANSILTERTVRGMFGAATLS